MLQVITAGILMLSGLFVLGVATVGIFRFSTMLNRIHVAAKCDTLGALMLLSGLIVLSGFTVFSLKLVLIIVFLWLSNPVSSHLVARAEVKTNPDLNKICDFMKFDDNGNLIKKLSPSEDLRPYGFGRKVDVEDVQSSPSEDLRAYGFGRKVDGED